MAAVVVATAPATRRHDLRRAVRWAAPLTLLAVLGRFACAPPARTPGPGKTPVRAELFSEERAWRDLEAQCRMGPRVPGTPGHAQVEDYIRTQLRAAGAEVRDLAFSHKGPDDDREHTFTNIVARFPGGNADWVILAAHYDTRPWADEDPDPRLHQQPILGANDGASGVAILLEAARVLGQVPPETGFTLIFFDGEDWGRGPDGDFFVGSRWLAAHWEESFPGPRPQAVVVVDMVGDADLRIRREPNSDFRNRWLNDHIWAAAARLGYGNFAPEPYPFTVLDDHSPLLAIGLPATDLIDFDYPPWHTSHDTPDKCSAGSLGIVGRVVLAALADLPPAPRPLDPPL